MNSQALQKRIIDGKLFTHAPIGDWPVNEPRNLPGRRSDEDLSTGATDTQKPDYPEPFIQRQRNRNWGIGSRSRHG